MKIKQQQQKSAARGGDGRRTVVVGVRMDQQGPEILTWALFQVAVAGDRVIALHITPSSTLTDANALFSVIKHFESVIAPYEGFCNLKQIELKLKVGRGSSIRRVLVQEAKSMAANTLILGVAHSNHTIGSSSTSIAKHCAKKLSNACSVIAVSNGNIVFQRGAPVVPSSDLDSNSSKVGENKDRKFDGLMSIKDQARRRFGPSISNGSLTGASRTQSCSVCSKKTDPSAIVPKPGSEENSSSISILAPETRPGWPLLRRVKIIADKDAPLERPKGSVVQWAMQLPRRYSSPLAVHPDRRHTKVTDSNTKLEVRSNDIVVVGNQSSRDEEKKLPKELESLKEKYSSVCKLFSYQEMKNATGNFSLDKLVGKGGSSCVYKGSLSDGREVAVKVLKTSDDALQEFVPEVEIITTLHHENIVSLHGFCIENDNPILVYDFLSRGSLEEILHDEPGTENVLTWNERYKVAMGVANALDYLHGGESPQPVIHRDVKSSNILLTKDFSPQLCDFGLSQWASRSSTHTPSFDVAGTFGYMAPEYFMYGKVDEKIDVYAFGVVLLELLSGRKPITTGSPKGQENLVIWATTILQGEKFDHLLDPRLGEKYDIEQLERMALAAFLCTRRASRSRPQISLVLKLLQGNDYLLNWGRSEFRVPDEFDGWNGEAPLNIRSHINLALLDTEDGVQSVSSAEPSIDSVATNAYLEDYLKGRWSRSSSFD